jgi:hypothetical protein
MNPLSIELYAHTLVDDRLAAARLEQLANLARASADSTPSFITSLRRRAAASLRGLASRRDGETLVAAPS